MDKVRYNIIIGGLIVVIIVLAILLALSYSSNNEININSNINADNEPNVGSNADSINEISNPDISSLGWRDIPLKDIKTNLTFKISDFAGKPVLIHTFTTICQLCEKQNANLGIFYNEEKNKSIIISLAIGNEKESVVKDYIDKGSYNFYVAVSPSELTEKLAKEEGQQMKRVDFVPRILLCQDQESYPINQGVKSSASLRTSINSNCFPQD